MRHRQEPQLCRSPKSPEPESPWAGAAVRTSARMRKRRTAGEEHEWRNDRARGENNTRKAAERTALRSPLPAHHPPAPLAREGLNPLPTNVAAKLPTRCFFSKTLSGRPIGPAEPAAKSESYLFPVVHLLRSPAAALNLCPPMSPPTCQPDMPAQRAPTRCFCSKTSSGRPIGAAELTAKFDSSSFPSAPPQPPNLQNPEARMR